MSISINRSNTNVVIESSPIDVVIETPGPQGPVGPQGPSGSVIYLFTQASPATPWVINHNLGVEPDVTVLIDDEEVDADIVHGSINQTTITFGSPQAGKARLRP